MSVRCNHCEKWNDDFQYSDDKKCVECGEIIKEIRFPSWCEKVNINLTQEKDNGIRQSTNSSSWWQSWR